jgi:omega-hydroxy-beta-dihydromenaquinone-9 sulfotransferase
VTADRTVGRDPSTPAARQPGAFEHRPVMVVGCGRSGTTLVYQLLCCHEDLAWFSNLTERWPRVPVLAAASNAFRIARHRRIHSRLIPIPSEGYPFWDLVALADGVPLDSPVDPARASGNGRLLLQSFVEGHARYQRRGRFVNKNTRNTRRVPYVAALVPDACFINVLRDPRATVASLLRVAFWESLHIWSEGGVTPRRWTEMGRDPAELAARLWRSDVARSLEDASALDANRYLEVRYEELLRDPPTVIRRLADFAELPWTRSFESVVGAVEIRRGEHKLQRQLTSEQLALIAEVTGPLASALGYDIG